MKNKTINMVLLLLFAAGIVSCYEDKGNYEYYALPEIGIDSVGEEYTIFQFDTLKINPDIKAGDSEYLEYSWQYWANANIDQKIEEISTEKNLAYKFSNAPGSYFLKFIITDKRTNTDTYQHVKVNILGKFAEGWLVMHEKNGKTDFDLLTTPFFVPKIENDVIHRNVYETANGAPLAEKGVGIASYYYPRNQYIYVFTENRGERLSVVTMQKEYDLSTLLLGAKVIKPQGYQFLPPGGRNYGGQVVISNGEYYMVKYGINEFSKPVVKDEETYSAAPFAPRQLVWALSGVIYDELHSRFLQVVNQTFTLDKFPKAAPGALFDMNRMNAKMLYLESGFGNYEYAVMQDHQTLERNLYVINFMSDKDIYDQAVYATDKCPEIDQAGCYAVGARGNVFYYGAGNKLYLYDYFGTNEATECLQMPGNEKITGIKILKPNDGNTIKNHPYDNKVLIISTCNDKKEGKVYMYYINESNGTIDKTSEKIFDGFGEILSMAYNYPKYG